MRARIEKLFGPGSPWPWLAVALLAIFPHLNVIPNPFAYDDWSIIPENPYMHHPRAWQKMFGGNVWDFAGSVGISNYYRPVMHVFNYAIFQAFGAQPGWYHLFCLALHVGTTLLVMGVVRRFSGRHDVGLLAGLLFAVHPVHSEVIAWIACSPELLASFFSLLAILLYLRAAEARGASRALHLLAMAAALLTAQLSKEIGVMAPVVIAAYELLVRRKGPLDQIRERRLEYSVLAATTLIYFVMRVHALGALVPVRQEIVLDGKAYFLTCLALFYRFLALLVWPMDLNFFRYHKPSFSPFEPAVVAGFVCLALFVALAVWLYRRRAPESLALPLYLLPLLPMFQLPYLTTELLVTERAAYLPSVGFCWLLAAGLRNKTTALRLAVILAILTAYTVRSAARMDDWRDEAALFDEGLDRSPGAYHLYAFWGDVLTRHNRPAEAVVRLREALRLREDYADAHNYLGMAYWLLEQPGPSLRHYHRAADLSMRQGRPDSASRSWNNIGIVHRSQGRIAEAVGAYRRALALDPAFASARNNLGYALLLENRVDEAIAELDGALADDPALGQAHANLGLAYAMRARPNDFERALASLGRAERLMPGNAEVHARLGEIHLARGELAPARARFQRALALQPQNPRAQAGMASLRAGATP